MTADGADRSDQGARRTPVVRWADGQRSEVDDWVAEEVPIALEFNGIAHAVMLATPADLHDFVLGFGLSEGLLDQPGDLYGCDIDAAAAGITVHATIATRCMVRLQTRRRTLAGRTGCGVCGVDSLAEVLRPIRPIAEGTGGADADLSVAASAIAQAMQRMHGAQALGRSTGSTHAAAACSAAGDVLLLREDVGRHNALDKLIGAMARAGLAGAATAAAGADAAVTQRPRATATPGADAVGDAAVQPAVQAAAQAGVGAASPAGPRAAFIAVTSRASVEMVQKACVAGVPLLAAISAPTSLAIDVAQRSGLGLVGLARRDNLVLYAHPERVRLAQPMAGASAEPAHL